MKQYNFKGNEIELLKTIVAEELYKCRKQFIESIENKEDINAIIKIEKKYRQTDKLFGILDRQERDE